MNKRIRELAEQAKQYALESMIEFSHTPIESIKVYDKTYNEKFAELIVRECMSVVSRKCASPTAYEALAEHFGVAE